MRSVQVVVSVPQVKEDMFDMKNTSSFWVRDPQRKCAFMLTAPGFQSTGNLCSQSVSQSVMEQTIQSKQCEIQTVSQCCDTVSSPSAISQCLPRCQDTYSSVTLSAGVCLSLSEPVCCCSRTSSLAFGTTLITARDWYQP